MSALWLMLLAAEPSCFRIVGDVMLSRAVAKEIAATERSPFAALSRDSEPERIWIGNLEGAVMPPGGRCAKAPALCLGIAPQQVDSLARFDVLSTANNHAQDFGAEGVQATLQALNARGIAAAGPDTAVFTSVAGHRIGWLGIDLSSADLRSRTVALERLRAAISRAAAEAELVVVLPHWGREGEAEPDPSQLALAQVFARWGAGLIAGSHPHLPGGARCAEGSATYFSLGNHLFDQAPSEGWMVDCCPEPGADAFLCRVSATRRGSRSTFPEALPAALLSPANAPPGACRVALHRPDPVPLGHPHAAELVTVERFRSAGEGAYFALRRFRSSFDGELALRPYVFRMTAGRAVDLWRGTALAWPLAAARVIQVGEREWVCAIHRGDSFLHPNPETLERRRVVYAWTGFGFEQAHDPEAERVCAGF